MDWVMAMRTLYQFVLNLINWTSTAWAFMNTGITINLGFLSRTIYSSIFHLPSEIVISPLGLFASEVIFVLWVLTVIKLFVPAA